MVVYYADEVEHNDDTKAKVRWFKAKNPRRIAANFGKDILVIEDKARPERVENSTTDEESL